MNPRKKYQKIEPQTSGRISISDSDTSGRIISTELDDGKLFTGSPIQFDGKNPGFPVKIFPSTNPLTSASSGHFQNFHRKVDELLTEDEWSTVHPIARLNEMLMQHCRGKQVGQVLKVWVGEVGTWKIDPSENSRNSDI